MEDSHPNNEIIPSETTLNKLEDPESISSDIDVQPSSIQTSSDSCCPMDTESCSNIEHDDIMDYMKDKNTIVPINPPAVVKFHKEHFSEGLPDILLSMNSVDDHSLLFHHVTIKTRRNQQLNGYVYTIDPVSKTIALINDGVVCLIPGFTVDTITPTVDIVRSTAASLDLMLKGSKDKVPVASYQKVKIRQTSILKWLSANRISSYLGDDSITIYACYDALMITPPYLEENFHCSNSIVLSRMLKICKAMPTPK